jgi:hypothetical protein
MSKALDNATVIQQINYAEWAHHDLQVHPERTMLKARDIHSRDITENRRKTNAASTSSRSAMRLHGQNYQLSSHLSGGNVDLKA